MALAEGTRLGPYEIRAPIGAGGMGEVYCATDTRLDRTVAIKVLPSHLSNDTELRQRFEREAKAVSSLNHPHICTLYDVGEHEGTNFLVMEYLEGETLAQRLTKGALPIDQALVYAIEISDALNKAHRQGVVHRDLKPANIMLTRSGAKLLDFGLAKLRPKTDGGAAAEMSTKTETLTAEGKIIGTLQYMAPEQVEGKEVDARTDIFAFGAVVYEMVTGKRPFEGETQAALIGAILKDAPRPVSALQPISPSTLDRLVKKCLAKEPDGRWQTVHDLHDELTWIAERDAQAGGSPSKPIPQPRIRTKTMRWAAAAVGTISVALLGAVLWNHMLPAPPTGPVARVIVSLSPADRLVRGAGGLSMPSGVAVSRDGTQLAYGGESEDGRQLYIRDLAAEDGRAMRGSDGAGFPFFSPDGEWVGFFADGFLKKVSVNGGTPITLAEAPGPRGASWSEDGVILFAPQSRATLSLVSADGGATESVTVLDVEQGETSHRQPAFLRGGKAFVFMAEGTNRNSRVIVQSLDTGERHVLVEDATHPQYSSSGHLLYWQAGAAMAAPFDLVSLELTGPGVPILSEREALLGVSDTGTLVSLTRREESVGRMVWVTRDGQEEPLIAPARGYAHPRLSPDGRKVVVGIVEAGDRNIWIHDLGQEGMWRLTFDGDNLWPAWTPDGSRVTYASNQPNSAWDIHWTPADGGGTDEVLWASELPEFPKSWSPDGRTLAFQQIDPVTLSDIWLFTRDDATTRPWLQTAAMESQATISPNGQWIAYVSNESGPREVYVRPLSGSGRWQVSTGGGVEPVWSRDGRELFYRDDDRLYVVRVATAGTFRRETPTELFKGSYYRTNVDSPAYDISVDGRRFLMVKPEVVPATTQLNVVLNWFEEVKRLVPRGN